jgi:hypothetical protein
VQRNTCNLFHYAKLRLTVQLPFFLKEKTSDNWKKTFFNAFLFHVTTKLRSSLKPELQKNYKL